MTDGSNMRWQVGSTAGLAGALTALALLFRLVVVRELSWLEAVILRLGMLRGTVAPWMEDSAVPGVCVSEMLVFAGWGAWIGYRNAADGYTLGRALWMVGGVTATVQCVVTFMPPLTWKNLLR